MTTATVTYFPPTKIPALNKYGHMVTITVAWDDRTQDWLNGNDPRYRSLRVLIGDEWVELRWAREHWPPDEKRSRFTADMRERYFGPTGQVWESLEAAVRGLEAEAR